MNINKITPAKLTQILNGTPLGQVMGTKHIYTQIQKAGTKIAPDGKNIHLLQYFSWLWHEKKNKKSKPGPRTYEEIKEAARDRSQRTSSSGRDIGPLPEVQDQDRKKKCGESLALFCLTYFPETFYLKMSEDHFYVIEKIEKAVRTGGLFALAMPRGFGKTSLCERATLWAALYGYRKFIVLVGASEDAALELADTIKAEIEENELLLEDFPEVCYPIRKLEGINNRANGQLLNGERTKICWAGSEVILPTVKDSLGSGAIIHSVGITGRIRGMKRKINQKDLRPDMVLVDDPQTDESAASPEQNKKRLKVLSGAILGLAGPGKNIAGVMPCTVIRPGDMADQILDKNQNPEWNGERMKLLKNFPTNMKMWQTYRELSVESYRVYGDNRDATEFYIDHREEMDLGAVHSWPDRFSMNEISGIQSAMNLFFKDRDSFFAEYQNEPVPDESEDSDKIKESMIYDRLNNRPKAEVPLKADLVTMFVDVQKNLLYWMVCAWADDFTGWIIDYGAFPEQKNRNFNLKDASPTYASRYPGHGLEGAIYSALKDLCEDLLSRVWRREDGAELRIERAYIDSGWGRSTDSVFQYCRESQYAAILLPSKGVGISAAQRPFTEYRRNQGDKIGFNWMIPNVRKKRSIRYILYDTNFWKSFYRERLQTAIGDPGSITIYGNDENHHRNLAEQLSSEISEATTGRGRRVDVWKMLPGRENQWLDCLVGNMVAANEKGGCKLSTTKIPISETRTEIQKNSARKPQRFTPGRRFTAKK